MTAQDHSDLVLWQRLRQGDEEAFVRLYRERAGALLRFLQRLTGSRAQAEDVLQDVFLALIDGRGGGYDPGKGSLRSFLFGMARNTTTKRLRGGARELPVDRLAVGQRTDDEEQAVRAALLRLEPAFREVVLLCDLEGLQYEEAAAALEVPVGTIRSRLSRARDQLAALLDDAEPDAPAAAGEEVR